MVSIRGFAEAQIFHLMIYSGMHNSRPLLGAYSNQSRITSNCVSVSPQLRQKCPIFVKGD